MVNKASPYELGSEKVSHRGRLIQTQLGVKDEIVYSSFEVGFIPPGYEHRPDLISNVYYGTPSYWWLILEANGIADPFESLNVNDRIIIPKL